PSVPPPLRWIIERCLAKEPEARYGSTQDLARDLQNVLSHLAEASGTPSGQTIAPQRVRRAGAWVTLVAVLAAIAAVGLATLRRPLPAPGTSAKGPPPVVAVLPLANLTGDATLDYLGVGFADVLITRLAGVSGVSVVSRGSTLEHQAQQRDLP